MTFTSQLETVSSKVKNLNIFQNTSMATHVNNAATKVYDKFAGNPGKLLLWTGTIGWVLSSAGQVFGIATNDKVSNEQKKFLVPQEMADAAVNIASFFAITKSCTKFGEKLVKSGKLTTPKITQHLKDLNLDSKIGTKDFDITKLDQMQDLNPKCNKTFQNDYFKLADGVSFLSSTAGSIVSCNIVTPILRNKYGASQQKNAIAKDNTQEKPNNNAQYNMYQNKAYNTSSALRI